MNLGSNEWENTSVAERYNLVTKAKMSEKRYRLQKRFSEGLKLLGDGFSNSDKLMSYLGENRQVFVENVKTVLEKRKCRLSEGLEIENASYGIEESNLKSSGNVWKDLDGRYRNEKQLLVKWLQVSLDHRVVIFDSSSPSSNSSPVARLGIRQTSLVFSTL